MTGPSTARCPVLPESLSAAADVALVVRMTHGDRSAVAELYGRHAPTLLALAQGVLRDRQEAEDVIHDVFLEAWQHCSEYSEARASVRSWLLLRTRSRAVDRVRMKARRNVLTNDAVRDESQKRVANTDITLIDQHRLPAALSRIPEAQQQVIWLAYFEGLSTPEIASRLGIPAGTVKSRTHAALATLRGMLGVADD